MNTPANTPARKTPPVQLGMRMPADLLRTLDEVRQAPGLSRSEVIVAALRAYLGVKSPAETLMFTEQKHREEPAS